MDAKVALNDVPLFLHTASILTDSRAVNIRH